MKIEGAIGLAWRPGGDGERKAYWICPAAVAKRGFEPRTQLLWKGCGEPSAEDAERITAACIRLQGEARDFRFSPSRKRPSRSPDSQGFVYFVRLGDSVKIGFAKKLQRRIGILQIASPEPLEIMGVIPGTSIDEREIHWRFREQRIRGEWFLLSATLSEFIFTTAVKPDSPERPERPPKDKASLRTRYREHLVEITKRFGALP